jgi:hypothetical protein
MSQSQPTLVDGHKRAAWLAKTTRELLEAENDPVWWRVRRHGDNAAHEAATLLEDYLCHRSHFPDSPDELWGWRTSSEVPLVAAMCYR